MEPISHEPRPAPAFRVILLTLITTLALLIGGVVGMKTLAKLKEGPKKTAVRERVRVVEVITAKKARVEITVQSHATAKPSRIVPLASEVTGRVKTAHPNLRVGGFVARGETLFELDGEDLRIQRDRLVAEVDRVKARQRLLRVQQKGARQTVKDSRKAVRLTRKQLTRDEKLTEAGVLAGASTDRGKIDLVGRVERLHSAENSASALPHQQAQAAAELSMAESALERATRDLARTKVVAEFDLQVRSGGVETGEWITAGREVAKLDDISAVELAVALPVDELVWLSRGGQIPVDRSSWGALFTGLPVAVERTGEREVRRWKGTVHRLGPGLDDATRMVILFVRVTEPLTSEPSEPPLPLLPGMFCRATIPGRTLEDRVVLPRKALQEDGLVFVAKKDDTLERRTVVISRISGDEVVVESGLSTGDRVIITTLPDAVDGTRLKIRGAVAPAKGMASGKKGQQG